ncbi:hypothetical protein BST81_26020 [Leptolyngbya sp. 'hensonii']|uniref:hypothetical protein n=1 Tax=Leptolyngbya sp. 'hensonii' TaxID=1922337 RepID=UPI00094FB6B9|nr:hypothetical protein [Leptolyngbya sp. 'hensonii']OLP15481.1 hypothetical protein BST81_26020 [Leptolyngbya sp. 'hensonii']
MVPLTWYDYLMFSSFMACLIGLTVLFMSDSEGTSEAEATERLLFRGAFACWMVYAICFRMLKVEMVTEPLALMSLQISAGISYLLTFSCVLAFPLHHLSASLKQVE